MRITDLQIERFGVWQDLHLPFDRTTLELHDERRRFTGPTVVYGPNGAGKTTLLRFIRGMLFGFAPTCFPAAGGSPDSSAVRVAGRLSFTAAGALWALSRSVEPDGRSTAALTRNGDPVPITELAGLRHDVSEELFNKVFAVGLRDVQELAALTEGAVGEHLYGLALGPDGQRIVDAVAQARQDRSALFDPEQETGRLVDAGRQFTEARQAVRRLQPETERFRKLLADKERLEQQVDELRARQEGIGEQRRGCQFLKRIRLPWLRQQALERQLQTLPETSLPERGMERLADLELRLAEARRKLGEQRARWETARRRRQELSWAAELRRHEPTLRALLDQQGWLRSIDARLDALRTQCESVRAERRMLGNHPDAEGAGTPPWESEAAAALPRIVGQGPSWQAAARRRARLARRVERRQQALLQARRALEDRLESLRVTDTAAALHQARRQQIEIEHLASLRAAEYEHAARQIGLDALRERLEPLFVLPPWVQIVLGAFGIAGAVLVVCGLAAGVRTGWLVGSIYMFLGATCAGMAWAMQRLHAHAVGDQAREIEAQSDANRRQLADLRQRIGRLDAEMNAAGLTAAEADGDPADGRHPSTVLALRAASDRIAQLERAARDEQRLARLERREEFDRRRLAAAERELITAREAWRELLRAHRLPEDLRVDEAIEHGLRGARLAGLARQETLLRTEIEQLAWQRETFAQRVESAALRLPHLPSLPPHAATGDAADVERLLQSWEDLLVRAAGERGARRSARTDERAARREIAASVRRIGELEAELHALLQAAGVGTAAEFRARGAALETRRQIELQLDAARDELNRAARTEPELAVVDDDLRRMFLDENGEPVDFDGLGNDDAIELLTMELEDLDRDRQQALAELNEVRCEIRRLQGTNPRSALVWERESARSRLQQAAVDWTAADLSVRVFEELRDWFEVHCQPAVLTDAAQYLRRLTRDQYHGLRVPLGARTLLVTDHAGTVLSPDDLSSGTREQLFLAVRLALVRQWARQGKHLPLVLDDVLVNFDRHRSEAMIGLLRDVAAEGQQIVIFTCHLHLAHQFQERGVEPLWLPNRSQTWNLREAAPRAEVA